MRGNRCWILTIARATRSIPAYAGEPCAPVRRPAGCGVYPRVCGGTLLVAAVAQPHQGLSPRMRGNPHQRRPEIIIRRSIPAYAGEPASPAGAGPYVRVYPRVCGGTTTAVMTTGLRMVYPRVCGGTGCDQAIGHLAVGLSPRMRGNPPNAAVPAPARRSIPAYAGEPQSAFVRLAPLEVYPRVCGGTKMAVKQNKRGQGLSPRMRGNRHGGARQHQRAGSIPAYAGEPYVRLALRRRGSVYPRVCGGTPERRCRPLAVRGLSPRMRGNPGMLKLGRLRSRSIPAYAGEPFTRRRLPHPFGVYPRVCGGTAAGVRWPRPGPGLSPRMRGNPVLVDGVVGVAGSIPAYAGEPCPGYGVQGCAGVYPRVCGGTRPGDPVQPLLGGLSPRMRGNPSRAPAPITNNRSIPAYAGEPVCPARAARRRPVYPRVCGGTPMAPAPQPDNPGLSPRMRGNPEPEPAAVAQPGSIPAYAGEPVAGLGLVFAGGVYPRVCGGTTA